jgi:hypothetical protein
MHVELTEKTFDYKYCIHFHDFQTSNTVQQ